MPDRPKEPPAYQCGALAELCAATGAAKESVVARTASDTATLVNCILTSLVFPSDPYWGAGHSTGARQGVGMTCCAFHTFGDPRIGAPNRRIFARRRIL